MPNRPRRRGNGEGSIFRRKDGRWVAQYTVETSSREPDGTQSYARKSIYGKTRREVAERLKEAMVQRELELTAAEQRA
jgi:hypothetical protein